MSLVFQLYTYHLALTGVPSVEDRGISAGLRGKFGVDCQNVIQTRGTALAENQINFSIVNEALCFNIAPTFRAIERPRKHHRGLK